MPFIEEADASPEVKAVYEDIKSTRKVDWINNFWKVLANDPATLKRTWEDLKQVMGPGRLDPVVKEMLYLAVSMTNSCDYCTVSHTAAARKAGMDDAMLAELVAIVGMANATNRMVAAYRTEPDERLIKAATGGKKT
jgi:AhpD family alkylhydroperoxidase